MRKILLALFLLLLLYPVTYKLKPILAQTSNNNCGGGTPDRATGLVTASKLVGKFGTSATGGCVIDNKTQFAPYKIPTYDDLKALYYTQAKSDNPTIEKHSSVAALSELDGNKIKLGGNKDHLYHFTGNLDINQANDIQDNGVGVIFVDGNLGLYGNEIGKPQAGLVFVVGGNITIGLYVTRIDAVLISSGTICTAERDGNCQTETTQQLTINGSLISLNPDNPPQFKRQLDNNNNPAEKINFQPKYLVLLRNLLSDTFQKWSEVP